jgi:hypothetical protein
MYMSYVIRLEHDSGAETRLSRTVDLQAIPRIGDHVDTGSPSLGEQPVELVAWHRGKGGIDLGRRRGDEHTQAELEHAGWRVMPPR